MNIRTASYWATTIFTASALWTGGVANLCRADSTVQGLLSLGYPAYFATILGGWKVLGGFAIVAPRFALLKEWAYAGIAFDLTAAAFSHAAMRHSAVDAIVPIVFLAIAAGSWHLRPASRKLSAETLVSPVGSSPGTRQAITAAV